MPTLAPNDCVQSWCIEAEIGRGAMARVYRVRHVELGTLAALKVLDRVDDETERRLLVEGRVQATAAHPGIVAVRDVMRLDDGRAALLMDLVDGTDLQRMLSEGPMPFEVAMPLFREILEAVEAAHAHGWVHRDLKPGNVLVAREGSPRARVGDFGMVKELASDATATRALLGTPRYMAPEQMRSARHADVRSDVFALGCILYEMVTGRQAFAGDDLVDLFTAKSGAAYADPAVLRPDLPAAVRTAIHGALTGSARRRIPSCAVFSAVLDGAVWPPASQLDETLDDAALTAWRCPRCGVSTDRDACASCGAETVLAGRFQLVDALAQHAPTLTYRALDLQEGRWVVARGLQLDTPAPRIERFRRGLQVLGELEHPQVPQRITEGFEEHGRIWEIRELIDGDTLADELQTGRLSERQVLETMLDLVPVLAYLHERHPAVVHRALVPEHIVRAKDGRLVLLDFAHVFAEVPDPLLGAHSFEGAFGGMAPEQYEGDPRPASDVYGLATLALALLTRRQLASLQTLHGLAWQDAVQVSEACHQLLSDMLSEAPEARPDVRAIGRRIASILADEPTSIPVPLAKQPGFARARRRMVALTLVASASILALGWSGWSAVESLQTNFQAQQILDQFDAPSELRPAAVGWEDRSVPRPTCDEEPLVAQVRVIGDPPIDRIPLTWRPDCGHERVHVADLPVGEWVEVPLPSGGQLGLEWWDGWQCVDDDGAPVRCIVQGQNAKATIAFAPSLPPPYRATVLEPDGSPALAATVRIASRDIPYAVDSQGQTDVPLVIVAEGLRRSVWHVEQAGVAVPTEESVGENTVQLTVMADLAVHRGRITDGSGGPVADAEVTCATFAGEGYASGRSALSSNAEERAWVQTFTDDDGRYACAFPVRPGSSYARFVQTPGMMEEHPIARTVADLPEQARLRPTHPVWVGCAGLPDGQCTTMARCRDEASEGRSSSCEEVRGFDGSRGMRCACEPDETAVGVGEIASYRSGDQLWLDFRDARGGFRGRVPTEVEHPGRCWVSSVDTDRDVARTLQTDADGRFSFDGLAPGLWWFNVRCGDLKWGQQVQVHDDLVTVDLRMEDAEISP